ncbi:MAG: alanyl-tRNA editing protein, partial [Bryobacteraceae bacterium]
RVVLQESAFYPSSGGQPFDLGSINGIPITEVQDIGDQVVHLLASPLAGETADCRIDWVRRFDHMQQHTGQHLLSAVIVELFGISTVAFHMGAESSSIELGTPTFDLAQIREAGQRANEVVFENRPVRISYSHASEASDLRKPSEREGTLRIVEIAGLDRSACGGTHVRHTGEIGPIAIRKTEKLRGNTRLEFLCGSRAVQRSRADYEQLNAVAQVFSSTLDDAPGLAAASISRLQDSEKARQKLAGEVAEARGRQLFQDTSPGADGLRRYWNQQASGSFSEEIRREAQSFTAQDKAIYLATSKDPAAVLLAVSPGAGLAAGEWLKPRLTQAGGKGGGNAKMAQGSLPGADLLNAIAEGLGFVSPKV